MGLSVRIKHIINSLKFRLKEDRSFLVSLFSTAVSRGISGFGTMFFSFVLARQLGASHFGQFMLAYSIMIGLGIVSKFGMDQALLKFASILFFDKEKATLQSLRKEVFVLSTSFSLLLALALFFSRHILEKKLFGGISFGPVLIVMAINLPFYANILMQSTYLKAFKRPEIAPFLEIGLLSFLTGIMVLIAVQCGIVITPYSVSIILLIATLLVLITGQIIIEIVLKPFYKETISVKKKVKGFYRSLPDFALSSVTIYLLNFSPGIILGIYATSKDVGLYSIANSTAFLINFVLTIVNSVTAPYFATYYKEGNMAALRKLVQSAIIYMLFIAVPIFLVIVLFPSWILNIFGPAYIEAKKALVLLAAAQLFNVMTGPVYFLLSMTGHQRLLRNNVVGTAVVTIVGSIYFSSMWGFWGAAMATAIGLVLQNAFVFYYANRLLDLKLFSNINFKFSRGA